jgi:hypothetical protein
MDKAGPRKNHRALSEIADQRALIFPPALDNCASVRSAVIGAQ